MCAVSAQEPSFHTLSLTPTHFHTLFTHFSVCECAITSVHALVWGRYRNSRMGGGSVNAPQGSRRRWLASVTTAAAAAAVASDDDWVDVGPLFAKTESAPEDEDSPRLEDNARTR